MFSLLLRFPQVCDDTTSLSKKLQRAQIIHLRLMAVIAAFLLINVQAYSKLTPRFAESLYTVTILPILAFNTFYKRKFIYTMMA